VRNKFTGGEGPGYHPLHTIRHAWSGLSSALLTDFSVTYRRGSSCAKSRRG
jgi:hypothetical protein